MEWETGKAVLEWAVPYPVVYHSNYEDLFLPIFGAR